MKKQEETFVIVKWLEGESSFFENYISFDKSELDIKCSELNKEVNDKFREQLKKRKYKRKKEVEFIDSIIFKVMDFKTAIETFANDIYDSCTVHDASY